MFTGMELLEHTTCEIQESSIDEDAGKIRGVKILGRVSKRGRRYSDQAFRDGARLYEGRALNFDHPAETTPGVVRGFMEQVGCLSNCEVRITGSDETDGVYGDMDILRSHPGAPLLFESARRMPRNFGLSHNAQGDSSNNGTLVEGLREVRSVDIVTRPATNVGLFESEDPAMKTKTRTVKQILADAPQGRWTTLLLEADPAVVPPDMAVDTAAEADPATEVKAALEKGAVAVIKKLFAGEIDESEAMKQIKKLLGMAQDAGDGGDMTGGDTTSSTPDVAAVEAMRSKLTRMEVKNLLLESNREATEIRVAALCAVPEGQRAALLESWPEKEKPAAGGPPRPATSPGQNLTEADGEYTPSESAEEQIKRLRRA